MSEVEIIIDGGRQRRWSAAEKLRIVEETLDGRESVSAVASRNGVAPNLPYRWQWRRPKSQSWRIDETSMRARGRWAYLYRAVDKFRTTMTFTSRRGALRKR